VQLALCRTFQVSSEACAPDLVSVFMKFLFGDTAMFGGQRHPLEVVVAVDGVAVRVELERSAIQHFLGSGIGDEETVSEFVRRNRKALGWAIQAHLTAHGVPLDRHLVITLNDLSGVSLT
jgi:hypothetical protein